MMIIDKNWYQLPDYDSWEVFEDYSEFQGEDITLLGNFPRNVEQEIAFRQEGGFLMGGFKLRTGIYVYYEIDMTEQKRVVVPLKSIYGLCGAPFDLEDIKWELFPQAEYEGDDAPLFDTADEV
jgi:hypothetical protein